MSARCVFDDIKNSTPRARVELVGKQWAVVLANFAWYAATQNGRIPRACPTVM